MTDQDLKILIRAARKAFYYIKKRGVELPLTQDDVVNALYVHFHDYKNEQRPDGEKEEFFFRKSVWMLFDEARRAFRLRSGDRKTITVSQFSSDQINDEDVDACDVLFEIKSFSNFRENERRQDAFDVWKMIVKKWMEMNTEYGSLIKKKIAGDAFVDKSEKRELKYALRNLRAFIEDCYDGKEIYGVKIKLKRNRRSGKENVSQKNKIMETDQNVKRNRADDVEFRDDV